MSNPDYSVLLGDMAAKANVFNVYTELMLQYPQFKRWSGCHNPQLHHYGIGGLARHTWEIAELGFNTMATLNLNGKINPVEFYLASLFHDTGKMYDYIEVTNSDGTTWKSMDHKRLIYHLPRSILIWHDVITKFPDLNNKYHDAVLHDILAHHGSREFGSPVAPKTHAAWLLHLCDSISARMDDCDRLDIVFNPTHK